MSKSIAFLQSLRAGSGRAVGGDGEDIGDRGSLGEIDEAGAETDGGGGEMSKLQAVVKKRGGDRKTTKLFFVENNEGDNICRRIIGGGSSFCTATACSVKSHRQAKQSDRFDLKPLMGFLFKTGSTAYVEPTVNLEALDASDLEDVSAQSLTIEDWKVKFQAIQLRDENLSLSGQTEEVVKALAYKTPSKKEALRKWKDASNPMESEPPQFVGVIPSPDDFVKDDGVNFADIERLLQSVRSLETTMSTLTKHYGDTVFRVADLHADVDGLDLRLSAVEFKVDQLIMTVGACPASAPVEVNSPSLWGAIASAFSATTTQATESEERTMSKVEELRASVRNINNIKSAFKTELDGIDSAIELTAGIIAEIKGDVETLNRASNAAALRNDANRAASLDSAVMGMERRLTILESGHLGSVNLRQDNEFIGVENRVTKLEKSNDATGVKVGPIHWDDISHVTSFLNLEGLDSVGTFPDVYTALQERYSHTDGQDMLKDLATIKKIDLNSNFEAYAVGAYQNSLPRYLTDPRAKMDYAKTYLSELKSYKDWEAPNHGFKTRWKQDINDFESSYKTEATATLQANSTAMSLSLHCISATATFMREMVAWMEEMHSELAKHGFTVQEAWSLVTQCAARIFKDMALARQGVKGTLGGSNGTRMRQSILWGVLNTHEVMEDYVKHKFRNHPSIASEYVLFLVTHPRLGPYTALQEKYDGLQSDLKEAKSAAKSASAASATSTNKITEFKKDVTQLVKRVDALEKKK